MPDRGTQATGLGLDVEPDEAATGLGRVLPARVTLVEANHFSLVLGERDGHPAPDVNEIAHLPSR